MRLTLFGDAAIRRIVAAPILHPPAYGLSDPDALAPASDLAIAHFGFPVTGSTAAWNRTPRTGLRRASAWLPPVLRAGGVRMVSLADDHLLDYENDGLADTLASLDAAGIAHAGAGAGIHDAMRPAIVAAGGTTVGLISFTEGEAASTASIGRPGINFLRMRGTTSQLDTIATLNHRARRAGAEIVLLALHRRVTPSDRYTIGVEDLALGAVEAGIDLVICTDVAESPAGHEEWITLIGGSAREGSAPTLRGAELASVAIDIEPGRIDRIIPVVYGPAFWGCDRSGQVHYDRTRRPRRAREERATRDEAPFLSSTGSGRT